MAEFERLQQRLDSVARSHERLQGNLDSLQIRLMDGERQFPAMTRVLRDRRLKTGGDLELIGDPSGGP